MDIICERKNRKLRELHRRSIEDPERYWTDFANKLIWTKKWDKVCDDSDDQNTKWFAGGELNACYECLDKHIEDGKGDREAIYYDSPVTNTKKTYTYKQIYDEATRLAGLLEELGVKKGDVVMIYMPMVPEGTFGMLASCRIGAIHICIPSGLPAQDLAVRIDHSKPKVVLMGTAGYHANGWVNYKAIFDEAYERATHQPATVLVWRHHQEVTNVKMMEGRDIDWQSAVEKAKPKLECVPVEANEPFFVVYTSGSTGNPKGIVHSVGGICVNFMEKCLINDDDNDDEVIFRTTNLGYITCHALLYQSLMINNKMLVFEGDPLLTSDPTTLYRLIQEHKITRMYVRANILKVLKQMDPDGRLAGQYNLQSVRQTTSSGEKPEMETIAWAMKTFGAPCLLGYAQTETGGMIAGSPFWTKFGHKINMSSTIQPGFDVVIMKSDNTIAKANESGRILIKTPLPPGCVTSLLGDHEKFKTLYFGDYPGYYDTKDEGHLDENSDLFVACRADDIMKHNTGYLSAIAVEEIVMTHQQVIECLVVPTPHLIMKELPVTLFVATNDASTRIAEEILEKLSQHFGVAVTFGKAIAVKELPRTRTGKIHRPIIRSLGRGEKPQTLAGIENPQVLEDIAPALKAAGYGCDV